MKKKPNLKAASDSVFRGTPLLKWRAPEYEHYEKGHIWKVLAILIVLAMVIYGVVTHSYPFAIVMVLFAGVYFLTHKEPREIEVVITDMGITADQRFYEFSHMRSFWLNFKPGEVQHLNLRLTKEVLKEVSLLLGAQDPAEVRTVLSRFIPELIGKEEGFIDWLIRKLRL